MGASVTLISVGLQAICSYSAMCSMNWTAINSLLNESTHDRIARWKHLLHPATARHLTQRLRDRYGGRLELNRIVRHEGHSFSLFINDKVSLSLFLSLTSVNRNGMTLQHQLKQNSIQQINARDDILPQILILGKWLLLSFSFIQVCGRVYCTGFSS